jgi:hypothetical protein
LLCSAGAVAALAGQSAGGSIALAAATPASGLVGSFEYAGGEAQREQMRKEIDEAIKYLNFFLRPLARRQLSRLYQRFQISMSAPLVNVSRDGYRMSSRMDGTPASWRSEDGDVLSLTHKLPDASTLVQSISDEDGTQTAIFSLKSGGNRLRLRVTVYAKELGRPFAYELDYRRTN